MPYCEISAVAIIYIYVAIARQIYKKGVLNMKTFEVTSRRLGIIFEIGIQEEPHVTEHYDDHYTKELRIVSVKVDGMEVPRHPNSGRPYLVKFDYAYLEGEKILVVKVKYDAFDFINELKGLKPRQDGAMIPCSEELSNYYHNVYLPAAEAKIEQLKAEKKAAVQAAFDALTDDTELKVDYCTSYGHSVSGLHGKHEWFTKCFEDMKRACVRIPDQYIIETDWGDYSISYDYRLPFGELKKLYRLAREIVGPKEKKAAEEKAAREARRESLKCEILKTGKTRSEADDPYVIVRVTDPKTSEALEFTCRNIFDVGYVVNPNYSVADGLEAGGIVINGKWHDFNGSKGGWYPVRDVTPFERRCLDYLRDFPPIYSGIRM